MRALQKPPRPSSTGEPSGWRQTSTSAALMMGTLHLPRSAVLSISSSTLRRDDMSAECAAHTERPGFQVPTHAAKQGHPACLPAVMHANIIDKFPCTPLHPNAKS